MASVHPSMEVSHPVSTNISMLHGRCPAPFLDEAKFTRAAGHLIGRLCSPISTLPSAPTCCLPCPATDWIYDRSFVTWYRIGEGISTVGMVLCIFLLITWVVLPVSKSRRHYLSVGLVVGIILEGFAFLIALGARPAQCYDEITPNDMTTNLPCAFSGAFVVFGALVVTVWVFVRALSMHLQICWDIVPGQKFFYIAQGLGWGISLILFIITMAVTGVSYRFGDTCHVNASNSMGSFWGPLLGGSIAAALVQLLTFLYCIKVYLRNVWSEQRSQTSGSSNLPTTNNANNTSLRTASARAVYRRVQKVIWLQWRSMAIVLFLLVDIIFFAIIWIQMDNDIEAARSGNIEHFEPFFICLIANGHAREKCFTAGQKALVTQKTALAILLLLSISGVQTAFMIFRRSMITGWRDLLRQTFTRKREFVSLDAKLDAADRPRFELGKIGSPTLVETQSPSLSTEEAKLSPRPPQAFGRNSPADHERLYRVPDTSFSGPRRSVDVQQDESSPYPRPPGAVSRPPPASTRKPQHPAGP